MYDKIIIVTYKKNLNLFRHFGKNPIFCSRHFGEKKQVDILGMDRTWNASSLLVLLIVKTNLNKIALIDRCLI